MAMPVVFVRKGRRGEIPIIKEEDEHNKILLPLHVKTIHMILALTPLKLGNGRAGKNKEAERESSLFLWLISICAALTI